MDVADFENRRWERGAQKLEFRHTAVLSLVEGTSVLDLGCGDGLLLGLLRAQDVAGVGLDISREAVARCKARGLDAQEWSFDKPLPYEPDTFDTVVLLDVLEHVYDPAALLKEAARVSRGTVVVGVPNFSSLPARLQVLLGRVPENNAPHKGHIYWFNYRVLTRVIGAAHLRIGCLRANTFRPFSKFGDIFVRAWPNLFALSFVVQLHKK